MNRLAELKITKVKKPDGYKTAHVMEGGGGRRQIICYLNWTNTKKKQDEAKQTMGRAEFTDD